MDQTVSRRAEAIAATEPLRRLWGFWRAIDYFRRRDEPGVLDFTFGDPREMPSAAYVSALREAAIPRNEAWFAYKLYEPAAQQAAAASLGRLTGLPFEPEDICSPPAGSPRSRSGMKAVADPGDEVIFSLPPWFFYEALCVEAGLVPVKVRDRSGDARSRSRGHRRGDHAAHADRHRQFAEQPDRAHLRPGDADAPGRPCWRRRRRATGGASSSCRTSRTTGSSSAATASTPRPSSTPTPWSPTATARRCWRRGSASATWRCRPRCRTARRCGRAVQSLQIAIGWAFPNAVMQYALPELETQSIDVAAPGAAARPDGRRADGDGLHGPRPQGTFYLFPRSPIADDEAFARLLAEREILVMPGTVFETPGFFRICLTATDEMCERALPGVRGGDSANGCRVRASLAPWAWSGSPLLSCFTKDAGRRFPGRVAAADGRRSRGERGDTDSG